MLLRGGLLGLPLVGTERWGGLLLTLVVASVGIAASFPLGILLALGRRSELPLVRWASIGTIELIRGVPLVTVLFMASVMLPLFLPPDVTIDKLVRALVGVAIFSAAYLAEVIRGGLQAIPRGQYEAADALGLGYWQKMGLIVLPQALRLVIPGHSQLVHLALQGHEPCAHHRAFRSSRHRRAGGPGRCADGSRPQTAATGYLFAGAVFWAFCFSMSRYSAAIERRLSRGARPLMYRRVNLCETQS